MPKHLVHHFVDKSILGKAYPSVHRALDYPTRFGVRPHRKLFHSVPEAVVVGAVASWSLGGGISGLLHILTDNLCSQNKGIERWLENMVKQNATRGK